MPPRKLYFENVRLGDELPAMARAPIERVQLARYAGATGDFNALHVDELAARALGMPSVLVPNTLGLGFLAQLVGDWARGAQVKRVASRFSRTLWPGDTLVCKGRVADRWGAEGKYFIEVEVWAENQKGELVLRGAVTLRIFYSVEDENRARMGQPPLIVTVPRQSIRPPTTPAPPPPVAKAKPAPARAAPARPAPAKKPAPKPAPKKPARTTKPAKKKKK